MTYESKLVESGLSPEIAAKIAARTEQKKPTQNSFDLHFVEPAPVPVVSNKRKTARCESSIEIQTLEPDLIEDLAFYHAIFCQVGLPRAKVKGREFRRQSGDAWLNLQAGYLDEGSGPVAQPLPYGRLPRLLLAHLSTYAVRYNTREIPIGTSASNFLKSIGLRADGREHKALRLQMHALAAAHLQIGYRGRTYNGQPVNQIDAWTTGDEKSIWPGILKLHDEFFESLKESAVPLDLRALDGIKDSALALDIYTWLAHRLRRVKRGGQVLHWKTLREQFGQEYQGVEADKNFKKSFTPQLKKVLSVYPEAHVEPVRGGILLLPSAPPIAER